ncbi:amylosucrase [Microbacterium sp. EYE_5]|uniref:amylosucrase n=1 Tax=unclassified Microbacterium TaxID=2609290 RepID=UPI0020054ED4|nr:MULTISPECIES: amylosucrase [unclassified Microbacterium]MCK6079643.1 amylosucrase [Microbacterium sp. EYE_382]MCK6084914.1 amylosucrase [Microbacterium sp. EYE_384]MCK6122860.1 amylosucrase [Microbacterium sp. EYE_80]MCK6125677.1 amylosucrase [Microbacterium sp. EYE_79]MCK6140598.1 amylosucrase [Microbacterium sp. EYE_39]
MARLESEASADVRAAEAAADAELGGMDAGFRERFDEVFPVLHGLFLELYGDRDDGREALAAVVGSAAGAWRDRPQSLKALDARRSTDPEWYLSERMLGGVCYVDRYAGSLRGIRDRIPSFQELGLTYLHLMPLFASPEGNNDGGYAVSSYREVDRRLGTMADLAELATDLREAGISLVVDFIFNHTSNEHEWARKAVAGEPGYEDFYLIFPDRTMPDRYEQTVREIFPDDHPGSFVQLPDGRWIWATFYHFQWDLNYANPAVFRAMAGEMLFLANQGVEVLRMDAVAFIWKRLGTTCESLPEAHLLLRAFNQVLKLGAPSVLFKSEAIVHPDEVVTYISTDECQLSYNPLQMALGWEALATRDGRLLQKALDERHDLPPGTAWVNYVRSHDDIGWTFADEDAAALGIDGYSHRRFLNDFYVGRFPGTFSRGVPFQENPKTGDARVTGTTASLAGVEAGDPGGEDRVVLAHALALSTGGIPLLYLGDELGQLNDYGYRDDPAKAGDSRWVHRPEADPAAFASRHDTTTVAGRIHTRLVALIDARRRTPEFAGNPLTPFHTPHPSVVGFQRIGAGTVVVLANVGDHAVTIDRVTLSGFESAATDVVDGSSVDLSGGLELPAHGFRWLRVRPA